MKPFLIIALLTIPIFSASAFEQVPITLSATMDKVDFDGRWTFLTEWKQSSLNEYVYDDGKAVVVLRSAHQDDFVYIFIDAITDHSINKGSDSALICFDTNNDKTKIPKEDDHCFMATLDSGIGVAYRGDPRIQNFTEIPLPDGFIGLSAVSDSNDRYTGIPHPGYEFRIPTDIIGRKSIYGFYFLVQDGETKKHYTYPQNLTENSAIPSQELWGEMYSPDKSLPEFGLPTVLLLSAMGMVLYLTKNKVWKQH